MSFGKRMRAERSGGALMFMALAASVAVAAPMVTPLSAATNAASSRSAAPREFADTKSTAQRATKKKVATRRRPKRPAKWDSRHARRRIIMAMTGQENSGRQWVRVRRILRRSPVAHLLMMQAWELEAFAKTHRLVRTRRAY